MTDSALMPGAGRLAAASATDKTEAFRSARRHSGRVRLLRVGILLGTILGTLAIVVFAFFNPFRAILPANVSIDGAGLSGSRVTMSRPKMSGYRKDGRPYDFIAESAVQDLKVPNVLDLNVLDAHVTLSNASVAHITAKTGHYDSSHESMDLKGDIQIKSDAGYDVHMNTAHIEFKGGDVDSKDPVAVSMTNGTVHADSLRVTNNGSEISFAGNVHSTMLPAGEAGKTVTQMKGTTP